MKNLLFPLFLVCQMFLSADLFSQSLPRDFDTYVEKVLKTFNVPGVSVAIVKDEKLFLQKDTALKQLERMIRLTAKQISASHQTPKRLSELRSVCLLMKGK